jgi:DNA-binding MarR family transcriptional regulator
MPLKMSLTNFTKGQIISMYENKITQVNIAKKIKIGQSTVSMIVNKFLKQDTLKMFYLQEDRQRLLILILTL